MKLIGYRCFTYSRKSDGSNHNGCTLYVVEDAPNVIGGKRCFEQYVNPDVIMDALTPGDEIVISYNRFGSVDSVRLAESCNG